MSNSTKFKIGQLVALNGPNALNYSFSDMILSPSERPSPFIDSLKIVEELEGFKDPGYVVEFQGHKQAIKESDLQAYDAETNVIPFRPKVTEEATQGSEVLTGLEALVAFIEEVVGPLDEVRDISDEPAFVEGKYQVGQQLEITDTRFGWGAFDPKNPELTAIPKVGDVVTVEEWQTHSTRSASAMLVVSFCDGKEQVISQFCVKAVENEPTEVKTEELLQPKKPRYPSAPMTKAVLQMIKAKGSLTGLEAGGVLKCRMLPFQISELRRLGWKIRTEMKRDPSDGQRYARYHLLEQVAA